MPNDKIKFLLMILLIGLIGCSNADIRRYNESQTLTTVMRNNLSETHPGAHDLLSQITQDESVLIFKDFFLRNKVPVNFFYFRDYHQRRDGSESWGHQIGIPFESLHITEAGFDFSYTITERYYVRPGPNDTIIYREVTTKYSTTVLWNDFNYLRVMKIRSLENVDGWAMTFLDLSHPLESKAIMSWSVYSEADKDQLIAAIFTLCPTIGLENDLLIQSN